MNQTKTWEEEQKYWRAHAEVLNCTVVGWNYKHTATFQKENGSTFRVNGWVLDAFLEQGRRSGVEECVARLEELGEHLYSREAAQSAKVFAGMLKDEKLQSPNK